MPVTRPQSALQNNPYSHPKHYYPIDLGTEGAEPYILFDIRAGTVKKPTPLAVIALPMPNEVTVKYGSQYDDVPLTIEAYKTWGRDFVNDPFKVLLDEAIHKGVEVGDALSKLISTNGLQGEAQLARELGKIVNPHMAAIYRGTDMRGFAFNFTLAARNQKESDAIQMIISRFKYHMSPGIPGGNGSFSRYMHFPDNFIISLHSPSQKYLFRIGTCALTSFEVDYTGSGQVSFFRKSGAPTVVKLQMGFRELEIISKEMVQDGY